MSRGRPSVDGRRAFEHLDALRAAVPGLSARHISRLAGIAESTLSANKSGRITLDTEERLLAVTVRHVLMSPPPQMPAHLVREHVQRLMDETGATRNQIARASGVDYQTAYDVMKPSKRLVMWRVHHALMKTTADDVRSVAFWTDRRPSITRLRALQANHWSLRRLGREWGVALSACVNADPDSPIEIAVARRIKAIYDHCGDEVGPWRQSAPYATRLGYKTPIHYDDDMNLIEVDDDTKEHAAQDAARMVLCVLGQTLDGHGVAQIVESLGVVDKCVSNYRRNCGIKIVRTVAGGYVPAEARPGAFAAIKAALRDVEWRYAVEALDAPDLDYVALLASINPELADQAVA